jgi:phage terminase large subunit
MLLVGNPKGHNWVYRYFVKKDMLVNQDQKAQYHMIIAPSTENIHLPDGYIESMLASYSKERIQRDIYGSFDVFEGQIFSEFSRHIHVVKPFAIPQEWTKFVGADHGFRNPAAFIWCAVDYDGTIYAYKEWYHSEHTVKDIVQGSDKLGTRGIVDFNGRDKIEGVWIDPSTRANRGKDSDFQTYLDYLPKEWSLIPANNEVETGIDRIKSMLKVNEKTERPRLYIFDTCTNLIEEISQYRYQELQPGQEANQNIKETPVKKDDHAVDALRYAIMSRPEAPKIGDLDKPKREASTLEGSIARELYKIRHPEPKDPFGF